MKVAQYRYRQRETTLLAPSMVLSCALVVPSLAFADDDWHLGYIDGPTAPPPGRGSFDRIAGSILNGFDFNHRPNVRPFILSDRTGELIGDHRQRH